MIYLSEHYSTAVLEKLVHAGGLMPPNQHYIENTLPKGLSAETLSRHELPRWDTEEPTVSRDFGVRWAQSKRSAVLFVPSFVARIEYNLVLNPEHLEFARIEVGSPEPVWWDSRLFAGQYPT